MRPDCASLEAIADRASATTEDSTAAENIAWQYGIRLFNNGYYWESHEVLEAVWLKALPNSRERYLLQAIIHFANACLKRKMSRPKAVMRLSALALESAHRAWPAPVADLLMGVDPDQLTQWLPMLAEGSVAKPVIELRFI